jgi:hypothetical protein
MEYRKHVIVLGAKQRRQVPRRDQVGLDGAVLALHGGLLDLVG